MEGITNGDLNGCSNLTCLTMWGSQMQRQNPSHLCWGSKSLAALGVTKGPELPPTEDPPGIGLGADEVPGVSLLGGF